MFVDSAKIYVKAGNGGNGCVSFHREKYVPNGGPDGGDGGRGGNVIFVVDEGLRTLVDFQYKRKYIAEAGKHGRGSNCSGKGGEDLLVKVPPGTIIKDFHTHRVLADLTAKDQRVVLAKGGKGGAGNQHFATATRQIPNFAKPGEEGMELEVILQLKLLADVGLVGFPNAGKSTLLSIVSHANPKIADYPFTTLEPNLGVVRLQEGTSFVMADIPGLIEGAHEGVGLGHAFLKHIERTRILLHVVDLASVDGRDPMSDFEVINQELRQYSEKLALRHQIVIGNKVDIVSDPNKIQEFEAFVREKGYDFFAISAAKNMGVQDVMKFVANLVHTLPMEPLELVEDILVEVKDEAPFVITKEDAAFVVEGKWVERLVKSTNFNDYESLQYFQRSIKQKGLSEALERMGIEEGDTVIVNGFEMEYYR